MPCCATCTRYIADWFDQELRVAFDGKRMARLAKSFQPVATREITRLLMLYLAEETHYEKMRDKIRTYIDFGGLSTTIHTFSTSIPEVADTVEAIDMAFFDASGKGLCERRDWIRNVLLDLFLEVLDVHRVHLGRAPFKDVWAENYRARQQMQKFLAQITITGDVAGTSFLESYLKGGEAEQKEWDELYA
jgi:hypothetical protein